MPSLSYMTQSEKQGYHDNNYFFFDKSFVPTATVL